MQFTHHDPVLCDEVLQYWGINALGSYADATFGRGGHTKALLDRHPQANIWICDRDKEALEAPTAQRIPLSNHLHCNYSQLSSQIPANSLDGILADLGLCSGQLDNPERGFSFRLEGPLDMRMDLSDTQSLAQLLRRTTEAQLANIIFQYGEEKRSRGIAKEILEQFKAGKLRTTKDLVKCIEKFVPHRAGEKHPATRTFQALRIAVNNEIEHLELFLKAAPTLLKDGGLLSVISFHSLEFTAVKTLYQEPLVQMLFQTQGFKMKRVVHPLSPTQNEQDCNPRSRSARLHIYQKNSL